MTEETKDQNLQSETAAGDDVIDLEGLVRGLEKGLSEAKPGSGTATSVAAASPDTESNSSHTDGAGPGGLTSLAAEAKPVTAAASAASVKHEPIHADELSDESFDELLMREDPELAVQMASIREVGITDHSDAVADGLDHDDDVANVLRGKTKLKFEARFQLRRLKLRASLGRFKRLVKRAMTDSKGVIHELGIQFKVACVTALRNRKAEMGRGLHWLKSRSGSQKAALVLAIAITSAMVFVSLKTLKGTLLPKTEKLWVASFADHSDGIFKYDPNGPVEDFNDPLLHPEFVILIERVVVNLAQTSQASDSSSPMAAFELYLQTDNQEAAVEIKDRNVEIRDAIARSVERMTYPDLVGEEGKAKLKLLIRKDLNEVITKGKIRRVFFKTIVLNPE